MGKISRRLIALALFLCALPAQAFELPKTGWTHAIAMHGEPLLDENADHFGYADPLAKQGGTIVQSEIGSFDTLNPFTLKGKAITTPDLVFDRLTARSWDEPFTLYGLIARDIWLAPDRKTILFRLDPKARFNDGSKITTDDIAFSFDTFRTKGRPNMRRVYGLVQEVVRPAPDVIGYKLKPEADRETPLILSMMPVLSKRDWQGKEFDATTLKPLLASAPYQITAVDPGRSYTMTRTPEYWARDHVSRKGLYNPERWIVRYFRDATVALEAFKKGDVTFRVESDPARWVRAYDARGYTKNEIKHDRPDRVRAIIFNARRAPLSDVRVREAFRLAFDQSWLLRSQGYGFLKATTSLFPNTDLGQIAPSMPKDQRSALRKADALLTAAGYGVKNGQRDIALTLILNDARDEKTAIAYQAALKKLGIRLTVKTLDTVQFTGALAQFDYDLVLHQWANSLSPGSEQAVYWSCNAATTPGSLNYAGICDETVDSALHALVRAGDRAALKNAVRTLDARLWALSPAIYLPHMDRDFLAFWPDKVSPGLQKSLYGFNLESLSALK